MATAARLTSRCFLAALTAAVPLAAWAPVVEAAAPLDPYAQAVVDSVAHPPPATPTQLLEAAAKTAAVEAVDVAIAYARRLADVLTDAGEGRAAMLARLGDDAPPGSLLRLESVLATHAPDLLPVVEAIEETGRQRRRDPTRIARAVSDLRSPALETRQAATTTLGRAGIAALPALAEVLAGDDDAGSRARAIARGLVRDLGDEGTSALLAQLGSAEVRSWPGVIAALDATEADDIAEFLLAPCVVPGTPAEIRNRAAAALERIHERRTGAHESWQPPSRDEAIARIARRLDHTLAPAAIQRDCRDVMALERRLREALHLARDLTALGATEPDAVRLVLLARLAALVERPQAPPATEPDSAQLGSALAGPDGLDIEAIADTLDLAVSRGLFRAAAAAARGIEEAVLPPDGPLDVPAAPLPPAVRRALVRALATPDAMLQFTVARTLSLTAGPPPWPGSSRVVETLLHAASAGGVDRVVVAHHDADIAQEIATGASRFGYAPLVVSTGRAAIRAAREEADVVLVILGARIILPTAYETAQFIHEQPFGDIPPVLVVIDPLDDVARGRFLTQAILKFSDLECVALVDRMESFFLPGPAGDTAGRPPAPPRFPTALAELAGPEAADPEARRVRATLRHERAKQAAALLTILHRRGWELPSAACAWLERAGAGADPTEYNRPATAPPQSTSPDAALPEPTR